MSNYTTTSAIEEGDEKHANYKKSGDQNVGI